MASMYKLSTSFQSRLDRERNEEAGRDKIIKYLKDDRLAGLSHKLDQPNAYTHGSQRDCTESLQKKEKLRQAHNLLNEDIWIPQSIDPEVDRKREEEMFRIMVQDSPELRELKHKLQIAEVNRQRNLQLAEKQLVQTEESAREEAFVKLMQQQLERADRKEQERLCKLQKEKMETRIVMEEQLLEKEIEKEREWEKRVQEQKEMNKLTAKLNQEREEEAVVKRKKQAEAMKYISGYLENREKEKQIMAQKSKEEEEEMARYRALQDQRSADKAAKEREKKEREEKIHAMLSAGKEEENRQREEFESTLNELYYEEAEERYRKKQEDERIKREHAKENLKASNEYDHYLKEQRKLKEKAEKDEFHRKMMEHMAQEHKLEQMNAQKQRMKAEEFKREIEKMWNEKKSQFHDQLDEAKERRKREEELQARRNVIIEEERQRLLLQHGRKLAKFLPKGTLESPQDFKIVGLRK